MHSAAERAQVKISRTVQVLLFGVFIRDGDAAQRSRVTSEYPLVAKHRHHKKLIVAPGLRLESSRVWWCVHNSRSPSIQPWKCWARTTRWTIPAAAANVLVCGVNPGLGEINVAISRPSARGRSGACESSEITRFSRAMTRTRRCSSSVPVDWGMSSGLAFSASNRRGHEPSSFSHLNSAASSCEVDGVGDALMRSALDMARFGTPLDGGGRRLTATWRPFFHSCLLSCPSYQDCLCPVEPRQPCRA